VRRVLVTSRSFDEYAAMFAIDATDLSGRVLDCSAGAADFVAVAATRGARAIAVDPAYALAKEALAEQSRAHAEQGRRIAEQFPDRFTWSWYGEPANRDRMRQQALARFITDRVVTPGRYVAGQLPQLPFTDGAFDLAVCSHLMFTWADELGRAWHAAAISELARVARQVRVFPTVMQGAGDPVPFWDRLMQDLAGARLRAELRPVPYEFQAGADHMLVVTSPS
jgi:SAM-dependent methyltransferase